MIYNQEQGYQRNHVIVQGREKALDEFLNSTTVIKGERVKHKLEYSYSSNSEDALTWSCFDTLRNYKPENLVGALNEILEDAFENNKPFDFRYEKNIKIEIGKEYIAPTLTKEKTEVDISIETDDKLIFIEAKLYSKISLPDKDKPHDQLIKKLRVGLDVAKHENKKFYFIFLDIAPIDYTLKFGVKSVNAEYFKQYKDNSNTLADKLIENSYKNLEEVSQNMGWLTWASLFKTVLRAVIK